MSLIEREKTLKRLLAMADQTGLITAESVEYVLESEPSAQPEQPEIIRCKDCKYWKDELEKDKSSCWLPCMNMATHRNWFCGSAERREDDQRRSD